MTRLADFCGRLRAARQRVGLRQFDVADAVGVTAVAVAYWELGRCRPTDAHLRAWATYLGVPVPSGVAGKPPVECGTLSGYRRHLRLGQATCVRCRAANAAVHHERRAS